MTDAETIVALTRRIEVLESEHAVRACMNRYMYLCDQLDVGFPLDDLIALFVDDATWEGTGGRYKKAFGRHEAKKPSSDVREIHLTPRTFQAERALPDVRADHGR